MPGSDSKSKYELDSEAGVINEITQYQENPVSWPEVSYNVMDEINISDFETGSILIGDHAEDMWSAVFVIGTYTTNTKRMVHFLIGYSPRRGDFSLEGWSGGIMAFEVDTKSFKVSDFAKKVFENEDADDYCALHVVKRPT